MAYLVVIDSDGQEIDRREVEPGTWATQDLVFELYRQYDDQDVKVLMVRED